MSTPRGLANEEQSFQRFYQEHVHLVYRYVYSKVGNREEAEDLTTQVFLKVMQRLDYGRDVLSIQKWLFQVARTTIADYWRVQYRISAASLDALLDAGWEGPAQRDQELRRGGMTAVECVQYILLALPEHYREVLKCRFLLNMSVKETALHLGLTEANVKVLQFRALKRAADLEPHASSLSRDATIVPEQRNLSERDYAK